MAPVFGRFLVYWAGSRNVFRRNRPARPGDPAAFQWHLMIPFRDEETVIAQTLAGLRAVAPAAHLWVIDDDSEDATREPVLAAAGHDALVHLVQRRRPHARIGKGAALNATTPACSCCAAAPAASASAATASSPGSPPSTRSPPRRAAPGPSAPCWRTTSPASAGLRSFDRAMPEEHNRVMVDHLSDLLCAATPDNAATLRAESLDEERIALTGNTVVEVVRRSLPGAGERAGLLARHGLAADGYVLATVHRPENTDTAEALGAVLAELDRIARAGTPVLFPMHPRTRAAVERFALDGLLARLAVTGPVGYADFLGLARHAALLVSDSGGVQEECTVLGRPLLVLRRSTERPEAVETGFAALVAPGAELGGLARAWLADTPERLARLADTPSPYGDGLASARIADLTARLAHGPAAAPQAA